MAGADQGRGRTRPDRPLPVRPARVPGRPPQRGARPLPDAVADAYAAPLTTLALALVDWTDPAVLTLTPEADAVMLAYQKVTESPPARHDWHRS